MARIERKKGDGERKNINRTYSKTSRDEGERQRMFPTGSVSMNTFLCSSGGSIATCETEEGRMKAPSNPFEDVGLWSPPLGLVGEGAGEVFRLGVRDDGNMLIEMSSNWWIACATLASESSSLVKNTLPFQSESASLWICWIVVMMELSPPAFKSTGLKLHSFSHTASTFSVTSGFDPGTFLKAAKNKKKVSNQSINPLQSSPRSYPPTSTWPPYPPRPWHP